MKWRGYSSKKATWKPLESLTNSTGMEEMVQEFMRDHPNHPAVRNEGRQRAPPPQAEEQKDDKEDGVKPGTPDTPTSMHEPEPQAAKYERGSWYYLVERVRPDGRRSQRWLPEVAFDSEKIGSTALVALRAEHLASLPPDKAALVATLAWFGEDFTARGSAEEVV